MHGYHLLGDFEYEYFLTDHLGNTRLSFGWLMEKDIFKATMETENNVSESANFVNLSTRVTSLANNHTATYEVEGTANEAARLNGFDNTAMGPGIVLENVAAGDRVGAEVFVRYNQSTSNNSTVAGTMFSLVTSAFGIVNGGETAGLYTHFDNNWSSTLGTITSSGSSEPKAYLNYILFRDDLSGVPQFGFIPVTSAATTDFEKLSFEIDVPYNGDMYIYVANESNEQNLFVWFDDLKVVHQKNNWGMEVTGADDYYPFGLQIAQNAYQRESALDQRYKYNGKELQPELGLNWYHYGVRMYDAEIGRFMTVDPMAHLREWVSPYNYVQNNPIMRVDPTGALDGEFEVIHDEDGNEVKTKVSTLGDEEGIDFFHQMDGDREGDTKVVNNKTGVSNWISGGRDLMRGYTLRNNSTNWNSIYTEWRDETGPQNSLIFGRDHTMNKEIRTSNLYHGARNSYLEKQAWDFKGEITKGRELISFAKYAQGAKSVLLSGTNMTMQMMGTVNVSFYDIGNHQRLVMINDSKSVESFDRLLPLSRTLHQVPTRITRQTYMWIDRNVER